MFHLLIILIGINILCLIIWLISIITKSILTSFSSLFKKKKIEAIRTPQDIVKLIDDYERSHNTRNRRN